MSTPSATRPPEPATRAGTNWQAPMLVASMWVAYFLNYCDRQVIFSIFPVLGKELGLTDSQKGLTGLAFLWVYGLCSPIAGHVADKYSKRLLVVLSLVVWSTVTILTGFSTTVVFLLVCRAAMGVSEALFMPPAVSLTANAYDPSRRSRALSLMITGQVVGTVAGGWFGGWCADMGHWRYAFFALGITGICYMVPWCLFLRRVNETAAVETKASGGTFAAGELMKIPSYGILCFVFSTFTFGLWLLFGWLPTFFYEKFSLTMGEAAFTATAYVQGATLIGMIAGGAMADRLYQQVKSARFVLIAVGMICTAPSLHFIGSCETLYYTKVAAIAFGLSGGVVIANLMASSFEVVPANTRASAVGFLNLFSSVISGFATLSGGVWKKSVGINNLLSGTAVVYLFAGLLMILGIKLFFPRDYARVH